MTSYAVIEAELDVSLGGRRVPTPLFRPDAPGRHPVVMLGMEATGINQLMRRVGRDLAACGYVAALPDYYFGGGPADPEDLTDIDGIMRHVGALDFAEGTMCMHHAFDAARSQSDVDPQRLAVWGNCTGATLSLLAACTRRDLSAAVLFYPSQPWFETLDQAHPAHPVDMLWNLTCPLWLAYGDCDVVMSNEQLADVRHRLERWRIDHEIAVFEGAGHAFLAEAEGFHHPQAARDSYQQAMTFLAQRLPAGLRD